MIWISLFAASALPMYAQRSGRTCGNCHVSPTLEDPDGWDNPSQMERKCTMSCIACHTDPTGGGLRNTSGRYFGASTLSMLPTQARSYSDAKREWLSNDTIWRLQRKLKANLDKDGRTVPSDRADVDQGMGQGQRGNLWVQGRHKKPTKMSFWDGRFNNFNADPILQFGGDLRLAYYTGSQTLFPMQLDLHSAVHPVHHLTIAGTAAVQPLAPGQTGNSVVFARRLYVMAHELPGMSWAKVGAFQPAFGTLIDDHISPVRTLFEASQADSINTVIGAEIGTAPNYPFGQLSVFSNDASMLGARKDSGWGAAVQGGYRELTWNLTGHAQIRQRKGLGRGDLMAAGVAGGLSPKFTWDSIPVTLLAEISVGRRTIADSITMPLAMMSETSFLLRNGLVAKLRTDVWSSNVGVGGLQQRYGLGMVVSPIPGVTFESAGRLLLLPKGGVRADLIAQVHLWF